MNDSKVGSFDDIISIKLNRLKQPNRPINGISSFSLKQTYINSRECPHCGSHYVLSNGNYKGRKRYLCKNCGKSYNDLTKTPFSGIHDLNKILKYLNCMISGDSIRKAATTVNVTVATSFSWRHKLLDGLNRLPAPKMKNVKEMMELEIPYSHKGQRSNPTKAQRKTKLSAVFVCDRTGKLDSDSIAFSQRARNPLWSRINDISNEHTDLICSTNFNNNVDFLKTKLKSSNSSYTQPNTINQIVTLWQGWMKRFHGVASKYLSNYLHWFDYLDNSLFKPGRIQDFLQLLLKH